MEDIFEDHVIDIDRCDAKKSLAVVDYVGALKAFYRKMEASSCVPTEYISHQFDINEKISFMLQPPWDLETKVAVYSVDLPISPINCKEKTSYCMPFTFSSCCLLGECKLTYWKIGEWRFDKRSYLRGRLLKTSLCHLMEFLKVWVHLVKMVNQATSNILNWEKENE